MKKTKKKPEQICGVLVYEGLQLPMIMVQGWFSDQYDCFRLFLKPESTEGVGRVSVLKRQECAPLNLG